MQGDRGENADEHDARGDNDPDNRFHGVLRTLRSVQWPSGIRRNHGFSRRSSRVTGRSGIAAGIAAWIATERFPACMGLWLYAVSSSRQHVTCLAVRLPYRIPRRLQELQHPPASRCQTISFIRCCMDIHRL
jgi:hypothetical protein